MKQNRSLPSQSVIAILCICAALVISSCTSSQNAQSGQRVIPTSNGQIVEVSLYEMKIHMPATFPAGHTTFRITNPSHQEHSFKIKGNGIEQELPHHLGSGESADLVVDLTPGSYEVLCPVLTHPDLGMHLTLTVTSR